jgi:hypothetical protein
VGSRGGETEDENERRSETKREKGAVLGQVDEHTLESEWFKDNWSEVGFCLFCECEVTRGAFWRGESIVVAICHPCITAGKLGVLIGDSCPHLASTERAVERTRAEAYRALAHNHEMRSTLLYRHLNLER